MTKPLNIVFFGTPVFAVVSLDAMVKAGFHISAVVTAPDKPAGRGMNLQPPPVKKAAMELGIPVMQPVKLKDPEFLKELKSMNADLHVVIAFRMLPESVWSMPRLGTMNLHASLLPEYRGAAPINWAIINGETETGVTTFFLKHEIDTGDMLLQQRCPIGSDTTAGELHDTLSQIGAETVVQSLRLIETGNYTTTPQHLTSDSKSAPKLFTQDCEIQWSGNCRQIINQIRGLSPYPGAFTHLNGKVLKVYRAKAAGKIPPEVKPGELHLMEGRFIRFASADEWVEVLDIQLEGKKRMQVFDFLKGYRHS